MQPGTETVDVEVRSINFVHAVAISDAYFLAERHRMEAMKAGDFRSHFHTLRLAGMCTRHGPDAVIVALLREVCAPSGGPALEDFPQAIQHSIDCLTPIEAEPWDGYLQRVRSDDTARLVKLEDLRLRLVTEGRGSLQQRYKDAFAYLNHDGRAGSLVGVDEVDLPW